ncbi:MAG: sulfotransferase family 2 domain-containing protein [Paracoccaceae bacterium]|nr:sulfotransferase family 2 domain-containing protein [Paracoccaceae bacterium]
MVVRLDRYKIAYVPLPKAGCSSVKEALARLDPQVEIPPEDQITTMTWHSIHPTRRFRAHRIVPLQHYWRFCVVRDPIRRLMSIYTNRVLQHKDVWNSAGVRDGRPGLPKLSRTPDPDTFYSNLRAYMDASSAIKHHAMSALVFLGPNLQRHYSVVYRTEDMGELAQDLSLRVGHEVTLPRGNRSETKLELESLQGATIDALRPYLEREYAYLKGFYKNPLGSRVYDACAIPLPCLS